METSETENRLSYLKLELMALDRNDFHDGQIFDELFGILFYQAASLSVPASAFQIQTMNEAALMSALGDVLSRLPLSDLSVQSRLVQRPAVFTASCLHESGEIGLGNMESRQPHDIGFGFVDL